MAHVTISSGATMPQSIASARCKNLSQVVELYPRTFGCTETHVQEKIVTRQVTMTSATDR
jgi:hypothetical protein